MTSKQPAYTPKEAGIEGAEEFILDEQGRIADLGQLTQMAHLLAKIAHTLIGEVPVVAMFAPDTAIALDQMTYIVHALTCPTTGGYTHPIFSDQEIAEVKAEREELEAKKAKREELEQWLPSGATILGVTNLND